jgi:hypothetical protein
LVTLFQLIEYQGFIQINGHIFINNNLIRY